MCLGLNQMVQNVEQNKTYYNHGHKWLGPVQMKGFTHTIPYSFPWLSIPPLPPSSMLFHFIVGGICRNAYGGELQYNSNIERGGLEIVVFFYVLPQCIWPWLYVYVEIYLTELNWENGRVSLRIPNLNSKFWILTN